MANHTTGAQRRNKKMDAIFERAKSEGRGLVSDSKMKGHGVNSPAMVSARSKAIHVKMADEINAKNKANPKRYKQYLEDSHSEAASGRYHE